MSSSPAIAAMHARVRAIRARAAVRAWEYRQRNHAKGVWFRLRRLLALSESVWSIPEDEANRLLAEGYEADPAGALLEPSKTLIVVRRDRLSAIPDRTPLPIRLGPEFLDARWVALVPFGEAESTA